MNQNYLSNVIICALQFVNLSEQILPNFLELLYFL